MLNLGIYEERTVCKMLGELAYKEGVTNMTEIKLNGRPVEKLTQDFVRKMPEVGMVELTYYCELEKENRE